MRLEIRGTPGPESLKFLEKVLTSFVSTRGLMYSLYPELQQCLIDLHGIKSPATDAAAPK